MIHSCTVQKHQLSDYRYTARSAFTDGFLPTCKTEVVHYRTRGATGSTNQNWRDVKLLPMSISTSPMDCGHVAYWEDSTTVCALMVGKTHLQLAHPPHHSHPSHPPTLLYKTLMILQGSYKTISKTSSEYCTVEFT